MNLKSLFSDFSLAELRKVPPSKKALNIVVGFDCVYKQVKIMRTFGVDFANADVQTFPFKEQFLSAEFLTEFKEIFNQYFTTLPTDHSLACYVVLPDNAVTMDDISLPAIKRSKMNATLATNFKKEYKCHKELQYNSYILGSNRQYVVYNLTILRKAYLTNLYRSMAANKLYTKNASYAANCTINSVFHFKPSMRKKSFIFLDIKADYTKIVYCCKGKTAGYADIMLGAAHLKDDKVLQENMQYDHDVADLAILNAKERAKLKALTVSADADNLDEVADDVMNQLIDGVNKNEEVVDDSITKVMEDIAANQHENDLKHTVEDMVATPEDIEMDKAQEEFEDEQAEEERKERLMQQMLEARKKKVFARKMPKRLPKFMQRPLPETKEGIVYENFRMILKWALLYCEQIKRKEYLPKVDCVLVNLPQEYQYLFDYVNSDEENNGIKFENLGEIEGGNLNGNLDLVGALYTGMYNKRQNF